MNLQNRYYTMQSKKIYIVLIVMVISLMSGCDPDLLTTPNPNEPTNESYWKTEQDAIKAINAVYSTLGTGGLWGANVQWATNILTIRGDDATSDSPWSQYETIGDFSLQANYFNVTSFWSALYTGVYRANQVIQNVPEMDIDENLKRRIVGEAKFIRGLMYFHLVNNYENVPLILTPAQGEEDYFPAQAAPEDVWNQVIQDFTDAKNALPPKSSYDGTDNEGRASWSSATGYLGRSYLYTEQWSEAEAQFQEIIDSQEHELMDNYRDNFLEATENNKESLFEVQFSGAVAGDGQYTARNTAYAATGFGWGDVIPSRGLFNAFQQEQDVNGDDDPRLHATMFYNRPGMTIYGIPYEEQYGEGTDAIFWRKYMTDVPGGSEVGARGVINLRLLRYADVLLMYAEANNEQGDQATAAAYIQMVRDRANMPDREAEFAGYTQEQMRDRIAHERFLELGGEDKRFLDIKRWGWLEDPDKLQMIKDNDLEFEDFFSGREILPIPQDELDTNPNMVQNPTY